MRPSIKIFASCVQQNLMRRIDINIYPNGKVETFYSNDKDAYIHLESGEIHGEC